VPWFVCLLPCPHLSVARRPPGRECSGSPDLFPWLTCLSPCAPQFVSTPRSISFFPCPHPARCALQDVGAPYSLSDNVLTSPSFYTFQFVSAPCSLSFRVLTCPSLGALQNVSAHRSLAFFPCPHMSVILQFLASKCPMPARFLSLSSLVHHFALSRK
jgi:hypothetical protein